MSAGGDEVGDAMVEPSVSCQGWTDRAVTRRSNPEPPSQYRQSAGSPARRVDVIDTLYAMRKSGDRRTIRAP